MRFAYHACMCPVDQYLPLAREAEALGFQGFTLPDSICYPKIADTKYPYNADGSRNFLDGMPFVEPFSAIPAMAAVTSKLRFTTSVVKLAIRNPVFVAKQLTTINAMFDNRFVFGVGLSPWIEDFEICGERWEGRGPRMDEMIEIIRGFHSGEYFGFKGKYYDIPECKMCPVPTQQTPILIGGHAEAALKRAAKIGDGWVHAGGDIKSLTPLIDSLNKLRKEYGRDHLPFEIHAITADAYSVDGVKRLRDLGVTECIIGFRDAYAGGPDNKTLEQKYGEMRWFADNIIAKC
jgi:probable F420-dependent oxidoreductase